ncbi:MAG: tryptophan-rich sensory protein [Candidatus Aureabacteria bacterium]|nr:tryptophan-rich sensory protein [Candidatus Auribacterota bacterium]
MSNIIILSLEFSMRKIHFKKLMAALVLPQLAGSLGAIFTRESVETWYQQLIKPSLNPPSWVFAPVWTTLFLLMGFAFYLVWVSPQDNARRKTGLSLFCLHLGVNTLWSFLFFGLQSPFWAFMDIIVLWIMITLLVRIFWSLDLWAGVMLVPYLLWVSFAAFLNYEIWRMN